MRNEPEDNKEQESEHPMSYGGYSARQTYEKNQRRWQTPLLAALFVLLFLLSTVGLIALFRGTFFTVGDDGQGTAGKVTVPVVNNNKFETPESAVAAAEEALITVEVKGEEKTLRGTGFVLSREGWAVCSSTLFEEDNAATATVYLDDGSVTEGTLAGSIPSLGIPSIITITASPWATATSSAGGRPSTAWRQSSAACSTGWRSPARRSPPRRTWRSRCGGNTAASPFCTPPSCMTRPWKAP